MLYLVFIDSKQGLGEDPPRDVNVFCAPRGLPLAWNPAMRMGTGCIEGIELLKLLLEFFFTRLPGPGGVRVGSGPVSHLHAAAAVGAGSGPEIIQGYKY